MSGIRLHPKYGINPFLTYCTRCGGVGRDLILVGADDGIYECDAPLSAGGPHKMIGRPTPSTRDGYCAACGRHVSWTRVGTLEQGQRIPGDSFCEKCEKEAAEHRAVVEAGGVYFKCADCGASGVIKPEAPLAKEAREATKISAPKPLGAEINKSMGCPRCLELEEKKKKEQSHGTGPDGKGSVGVPDAPA